MEQVIRWLVRLWLDRHDAGLDQYVFAIRPRTALGYDQAKASAGAAKARRRSATGKLLPKPKPAHQAEIVPLRRAK